MAEVEWLSASGRHRAGLAGRRSLPVVDALDVANLPGYRDAATAAEAAMAARLESAVQESATRPTDGRG